MKYWGREGKWSILQEKVYKSVKLWNLLLDLEESFGTMETTKAAYNRMFDLKIITAQVCHTFFVCYLECPELCFISWRT